MASSTVTFSSLPLELILEISDYLPRDGMLSLKLTSRFLHDAIPKGRLERTAPSPCARFAIRAYLTFTKPKPTHTRCILCKASYPHNQFSSYASPVHNSHPLDHDYPKVIEIPGRFCNLHLGRLCRKIDTSETKDRKNEWVSTVQEICLHCGSLQHWKKCECKCDTCWFRMVRTFTRYLNNGLEYKKFQFWRRNEVEGYRKLCMGVPGNLLTNEVHYEDEPDGDSSATTAIFYE